MAFYTDNRFANASDDFNIQVEAAAGYDGALGCQFAYIESVQESQDIFETALRNDFEEAYAAHSMNESAVIAIQEGGIRDMCDKIVEFFKNLWKKIKGIFLGFEAKFRSVFVKSNKDFVKKYLPLLRKKDFKDFKVKCDLPKEGKTPGDACSKNSINNVPFTIADAVKNMNKEYDSEEMRCSMLKNMDISISSFKDLKKEMYDSLYDGPEVKDGTDIDIIDIATNLSNSDKELQKLNKFHKNYENGMKKIIKEINNDINKIPTKEGEKYDRTSSYTISFNHDDNSNSFNKEQKTLSSPSTKEGDKNYSKALNYLHKKATDFQAVVLGVISNTIHLFKYGISQMRKVVAAAVAYKGSKNYTEYGEGVDLSSQEYLNAIMEAEQYDIDVAFESFDLVSL